MMIKFIPKKAPVGGSVLSDNTRDRLASVFLFLLVLTGINTLLTFCNTAHLQQLASRRPTQVQLVNGQSVVVSEKEANYRTPQVIQNFMRQWIVLTWSWDTKIDPKNRDLGRSVGNNKKVTTPTWFAASLLRQGFDEAFLKEISGIVPLDVFNGKTTSVAYINFMSQPRQVRPGQWQVDILATRIISRVGGRTTTLRLNKTYTVGVTDYPPDNIQRFEPWVQELYNLRNSGLQILDIREYKPS
jgi:uncharacterized protein YlzI (FlbEa/FlbD family)